MPRIRPLERDDLPQVTELLRLYMGGGPRPDAFLRGALLDHPWGDDQAASIVSIDDDGAVAGYVGAQVRRILLGKRELRGICIWQIVVDPNARGRALGPLLFGHYLRGGDQDITFTDTSPDVVARVWRAFGGGIDHARNCDWMLVLRPGRWLGRTIAARARGGELGRKQIPVPAIPGHVAGRLVRQMAIPAPSGEVQGEDATPEAIVEHLGAVAHPGLLRVDYDAAFLEHQFRQVESVAGPLVRRVVRVKDAPVGWYSYLPRRDGASRVLNLTTLAEHADALLDDLRVDALDRGCHALCGRLEPHLAWPLRRRHAVLGFGVQPLIHARDPEIRAVLATESALVTEFDCVDGDWWDREGE